MATEALTIRAVGNSAGVLLPKDLLEAMGWQQGDRLFVTRTADGVTLRAFDENFAKQMNAAREVMRKDRMILRELAK